MFPLATGCHVSFDMALDEESGPRAGLVRRWGGPQASRSRRGGAALVGPQAQRRARAVPAGRDSTAPGGSDVELDALGQGQLARVVDGVGGAAHVGFPGVGAGFAATAGFLLATEGAADLGARGADVDVGDAAVGGGQEAFGL